MTEYEKDQVRELVEGFKEEISLLKESQAALMKIIDLQNDTIDKYKKELEAIKAVIHGINEGLNKESD